MRHAVDAVGDAHELRVERRDDELRRRGRAPRSAPFLVALRAAARPGPRRGLGHQGGHGAAVGWVQRRVDLVAEVEGGRVAALDRKDQGQRDERLLAAGQGGDRGGLAPAAEGDLDADAGVLVAGAAAEVEGPSPPLAAAAAAALSSAGAAAASAISSSAPPPPLAAAFCITSSPLPPGTSSANTSLKLRATPLKVRSKASSFLRSRVRTSWRILASAAAFSSARRARDSRSWERLACWSRAFWLTPE